jgi:hypothetical protein
MICQLSTDKPMKGTNHFSAYHGSMVITQLSIGKQMKGTSHFSAQHGAYLVQELECLWN